MSLRDKAISIFGQMISSIDYKENLEPAQAIESYIASGADHMIQDNLELTESKLRVLKPYFEVPKSFLEETSVVNDPGLKWIFTYDHGSTKELLMSSFQSYLSTHDFNQSFVESALICLEELFMNSTIDAPAEASKLGLSLVSSRVHFTISIQDSLCLLSCWDSYGALDVSKFLARMNYVYQQGAGPAMNRGSGGAGLGCMILFENCMSLALGSSRDLGTRFVCLLPTRVHGKKRASLKKSIHHFKLK